MMNLNYQQPRQREMSMEEKLMQLLSGSLPAIGTAVGAGFGGPPGAALGGALGGLGGMGLNAFMPQQQMQQQEDQPVVIGGQNQGMQQMPMQQQGMPGMEQFGMGLGQSMGNLGSQGIQGLLGMLSGQQQDPMQGMMGKMDDTLREKLARILALKSMMGRR